MNTQQRKYALERVDFIAALKTKAVEEKFKPKTPALSPGEKAALIKSGKAKVRPSLRSVYDGTEAACIFDFGPTAKIDEAGFAKAKNAIWAEARRIKDEIMLGDEQIALAALRSFESSK